MPTKKISDLGPLEHSLLDILWQRKQATAGEVLAAYNDAADKLLAYTTVITLLTRMVDKGILRVDKGRQPFNFTPSVTREQLLRQRVRDFVSTFFDGQNVDLALRLVEDEPLTEEAIQQLEAALQKHKSGRKQRGRKGARKG
ncbi:MAG TPA: BlaI/MecI/CopY family transcriptional regulator [Pyrinomonadaceae bacterium]|nr:BlaI/MecI/CopY family transcriptional regulator [Pyrinomonadaceae bacterium]